MEELILRRTRAKTPVYRVGQLESKQDAHDAQLLAQRYQALLPPRLMTPFLEIESENEVEKVKPSRTIRKMKRQQSLRGLMKKHSRAASISDSETLVGSESPKSPMSPWLPDFEVKRLDDDDESDQMEELDELDNDMALKKCMELLSHELSTSLATHQPLDQVQQSSGLQILLMIESYERVQQHLRKEICKSHVTGEKDGFQDIEQILEYWLKVLYSVYDRSYELSKQGNEEYFPPPLSVISRRKPPVRSIHRKPLPGSSHIGFMEVRSQRAGVSC